MLRNPVVRRVIIFSIVGLIFGAVLTEVAFLVMPGMDTRPPRQVVLVIPPGTAQRVAQGQQPPSIPQGMTFVVGDTLVVKNEDSEPQQLGPLWIPAGSSASLPLNVAQNYSFQCSFVPTKLFGLSVNQPLTGGTRLEGIVVGGIPVAIITVLYSFMLWPLKKTSRSS
ncbi:MAG TPA: hypothetical protein VLZ89_09705 [Anaerolineales bacterium]|nr:hypothetical protein [Anaerolineales bacterium]